MNETRLILRHLESIRIKRKGVADERSEHTPLAEKKRVSASRRELL